jgi:glycosyltransferase involved in cell wall biosynthesis
MIRTLTADLRTGKQMNWPPISVVIPVHNGARFIGEAIESVFAQTCAPVEIIVVDDGSTDGTEDVVRTLSGPVPLSFVRQAHQGAAVARNRGVQDAKGKWVAFLDADDLWYSNKLEVQVEALRRYPEVPFVYSTMDYCDDAGHPKSGRPWEDVLGPLLYQGQPGAFPSTVLVRKDVLLACGGFSPALHILHDGECFGKIALRYPLHCIRQNLVRYRMHPNQVSENKTSIAKYWPVFHRCIWDMWRQQPERLAVLLSETLKVCVSLMQYFISVRDYGTATKVSSDLWELMIQARKERATVTAEAARSLAKAGKLSIKMGDATRAGAYYRLACGGSQPSWESFGYGMLTYFPGAWRWYCNAKKNSEAPRVSR